jgi:hypothetical protein
MEDFEMAGMVASGGGHLTFVIQNGKQAASRQILIDPGID